MGNGDEYIDLSSAYLHIAASISDGGVTNPTIDNKAAPVNNWVQSLFSQVDVSLNHLNQSGVQNGHFQCSFVRELMQYIA